MNPISSSIRPGYALQNSASDTSPHGKDTDSISVANAIEDTVNLSSESRNLAAIYNALSPDEKTTYLENLARLLKAGVVGTETLTVRGQPYQSFVTNRFADPELAHARPRR
tara:strand:- start:139 stop:471 length:333 start_codon:yes stop_codon:yes gene_type:complete